MSTDWMDYRPRLGLALRRFLFTALLLLLAIAARADIEKITVDGIISPITTEFINRAIADATAQHADALLIELRTPGGLSDATRDIIQAILASRMPVIIYVVPSGARAASAGFFILESADVAAMAPGTNTGAAHPVALGGGAMDEVMKEKVENDAAALMRSVVAKRGRNVEVAESAVRQSKSFTDQEALAQHLIDLVAKDDADLFRQLEGRAITRFDGSKVTLHLVGKQEREYSMTLRQRVLAYIMDPNVAFILLAIGALALYLEFNHPGAVVPGVVGVIFILLAVFAFNLLPVRFAAVALILLSFVLFTLEAKFQTHGILAVGGIATMIFGALLLVDSPIPEMQVRLTTALAVSIPLGAITVFLMTLAIRARRNKRVSGSEGMVGSVGVARTPLVPEGKVFVHGEIWNAVSSTEVPAGQRVIVQAVNGLTLRVEPVKENHPNEPTPGSSGAPPERVASP